MATETATVQPVLEGIAGVFDGKLVLSQGITRTLGSGAGGRFAAIPVIDLSALVSESATEADKAALVKSLRDGFTRVGLFVIKNHGIDWAIVEDAFAGLKQFFDLPMETKMKYHQSKSQLFMGYEEPYYTNVDRLKKGGVCDMLHITSDDSMVITNPRHRPKRVHDHGVRSRAGFGRGRIST
jgi:hypothetical protein